MVVDVRRGPEQDETKREPEQLTLEVVGRVVIPQPALHLGSGKHHDEPERGQRRHGEQQGAVAPPPDQAGGHRPPRGGHLEGGSRPHWPSSASTVALKRRPRSSNSENISNLVNAGERSTTNPGRASAAAFCTASLGPAVGTTR